MSFRFWSHSNNPLITISLQTQSFKVLTFASDCHGYAKCRHIELWQAVQAAELNRLSAAKKPSAC